VKIRRNCLSVGWVLLLVLFGCATRRPGDPVRPGFNVFGKEQDVEIGQQAAAQVRSQVDIVNDRQLQQYVSKVGNKLAAHSEAGGYPYSFTLINENSINAFALPGGPVFIHSGLIEAADSEAQFAGVLAHEIGHVALRHATNQASKANLLQFPAALAAAVIGDQSAAAQLGQAGLGLGINSVLLKYSRDAEREADVFGAQLMAKSGYSPLEMAHFFEKLEEEGGSRAPEFLSSHPNPGNRVEAVQAESKAIPQKGDDSASSGDFERVQRQIAQLRPPRKSNRPVAGTK
jgi:predicted Zn-dependent protease